MTRIINCECQHEFQDKRYGAGKRVANITDNGDARCTICGKTKGKSDAKAEAKK